MMVSLKLAARAVVLAVVFPLALLGAFGRFRAGFEFFAHLLSLAPGLPGSYLRVAYYSLTLQRCSLDSYIGMGSFFSHPDASVGKRVYIGPACVMGRVSIADEVQIATGVQILSGRQQHGRDTSGRIQGSETGRFEQVSIGSQCWIGAGAIVMADVREGCTIGAGSVVTQPVPAYSVAVGSPARVVKSTRVEN